MIIVNSDYNYKWFNGQRAWPKREMTILWLIALTLKLLIFLQLLLIIYVCLSIKMEFKQLLMLLLVSNTTESHLLEVISWVYVSKLGRRGAVMKRGKEHGPDVN